MLRHNRLSPKGFGGKLGNFLLNLFWAVAWLGRWGIRLARKAMGKLR